MRRMLYLSVVAALCSAGAYAQMVSGFGEISGTVRDTQGEGIPDTTVIVINENLNVTRTMTTSDFGVFDAINLPPAPGYSIEVTRKSFEKWTAKNIEVPLGRPLNFNITLLMEKEPLPEGTPGPILPLNETTYDISRFLDPADVEGLPSASRRVGDFAVLAPTIMADGAGSLVIESERSTIPTLIDGSLATDLFHLQTPPLPGLPLDSIMETQVVAAGVTPQFPTSMLGVIDVATRSGTNDLHGSIYDYFNSHGYNASNKYGNGFRPTGSQQQGGGSAGGRIQPDKEFWFVNAEVLNGTSQAFNRITNPLLTNPAGTTIPAANCTATAAQCLTAIKFIESQMNVVVPESQNALSGVAKLDYHLGDGNTINLEGDARHMDAPNSAVGQQVTTNGGLLGSNGTVDNEGRHAKADWTTELGTHIVNDVRVTWFHDRLSELVDPKLLPSTGNEAITVAGTPIGGNSAAPGIIGEQRWQFADHFSVPLNASTLKIGFEYDRNGDGLNQLYNHFGDYDYATLTQFATDFSGNTTNKRSYAEFAQTLGTPAYTVNSRAYGVYLQGNWKPTRKWAISYGLRWDKSLFKVPPKYNTAFYETNEINSPNKDAAPRLGLAYLWNEKTIVRASAGEYFQPFTGDILNSLYTQNGVYQNVLLMIPTLTGAPIFPRILATSDTYPAGSQSVEYSLAKWRNPHTLQGNVSIERRLGKETTVTVSGLYTRGVGLWTVNDQNLLPPVTLETYLIDNAKGAQVNTFQSLMYTQRSNGAWAQNLQIDNEGSSLYYAGMVQLRKQMSHSISAQFTYTWSHTRDDVSGPGLIGSAVASTYDGDYRADQGAATFDQRHRVTGSWVWQPRLGSDSDTLLKHLVNGWQVSGLTTLGSSLHQTATVIVNGQQFSAITMPYTTSMDGSGLWSRVPFYPVNSLSTGPMYDVDARVSRSFSFGERLKLTLMAEAFNVLNMQYNTSVRTVAFTSTPALPSGLLNGHTSGTLKPVPLVGAGSEAGGYPFGTNARRAQIAFRFTF